MNSSEWNMHGWKKFTNPSGEVIRTKTYERLLIAWDNESTKSLISKRKKLADLLGVSAEDLYANLEITINIKRYPRHRRFNKYTPLQKYYKKYHSEKKENGKPVNANHARIS